MLIIGFTYESIYWDGGLAFFYYYFEAILNFTIH